MSSLDLLKWLDRNPTRIKPVYGYLGHPRLWAYRIDGEWWLKPTLREAITAAMKFSDVEGCSNTECPHHSKEPWPEPPAKVISMEGAARARGEGGGAV